MNSQFSDYTIILGAMLGRDSGGIKVRAKTQPHPSCLRKNRIIPVVVSMIYEYKLQLSR